MKKQHQNRNYNTQDADLYRWCMEAIRLAHRDSVEFQQYGYSLEKLKAFNIGRGCAITHIHVAAANKLGARCHPDLIGAAIGADGRTHGVCAV